MHTSSKKIFTAVLALFAVPAIASAQTLGDMLVLLSRMINALMPFLVGLAVLFVMWGAFIFVKSADNPEARSEGINRILYGVIGIFVMVSLWGFVNLLAGTFRLDTRYVPPLPQFGAPGGAPGGGGGGSEYCTNPDGTGCF